MFDISSSQRRQASHHLRQGRSEGGHQMRQLRGQARSPALSRRDRQDIELAMNLIALSWGLVAYTQRP